MPTLQNPRSPEKRAPSFERKLREELARSSCLETPVISEQTAQRRARTDRRLVPDETEPFLVLRGPELDGAGIASSITSDAHLEAKKWRAKVLARLELEDEDELAEKIRKCGDPIRLHCGGCGRIHDAERRCSLKWCPVCQRKRATQRSLKYATAAAAMQWPLHVTLTITNLSTIDRDDVIRLKRAFKALRRQVIWSTNVKGGIVSIELTNTGKGWHPHLHTLIDCEWLAVKTRKPQRWDSRAHKKKLCQAASIELERAWSACVDQMMSSIAVRRCDGATAITEVLKYAVKGSDLADSRDPIGPAIRAISAGRLCTPFGSMYGLDLKPPKKAPLMCPCGCADWMPDFALPKIFRPKKFGSLRSR